MKLDYNNVTEFNINVFLEEISSELKGLLIGAKHVGTDLELYVQDSTTTQQQTDFGTAVANHDAASFSEYRVLSLINKEFSDFPIENIDFARHLKSDIALNKKVSMLANGRPDYAEYYNGADLVAKIYFEFTADASNLLLDRKEKLVYIKEDGTESPQFTIKHKIYDHTDEVDGISVMSEREDARKNIVEAIKAFLGGFLQVALSKTLPEVVAEIKPFWDDYAVERRDFIELADSAFKDAITAIDLTDPNLEYSWLALNIDPSTTVKDYLISKLTY